MPFFWSQRWVLLSKVPVFGPQKMALLASSCSSPSDVEEMKGCSCASPPKLCSDLKVKLEVNAGHLPQRERPNDKQALILIPSSSYCNHHNHHHDHNHNHHHHCHHSHIVIIGRIIEQPSGWMGHMSSI